MHGQRSALEMILGKKEKEDICLKCLETSARSRVPLASSSAVLPFVGQMGGRGVGQTTNVFYYVYSSVLRKL